MKTGPTKTLSEGWFHCTIPHVNDSRVKADGSPLNATVVEFEVLAGTPSGYEGQKHTYFINLSESGNEDARYIERCTVLCQAARIIDGQTERDVAAEELENAQVVVHLVATTKNDKTYLNVGDFGREIYALDDPRVAHIPKQDAALAIWRQWLIDTGKASGVNGNGSANGNGQSSNGNGHATPAGAGATAAASTSGDDI